MLGAGGTIDLLGPDAVNNGLRSMSRLLLASIVTSCGRHHEPPSPTMIATPSPVVVRPVGPTFAPNAAVVIALDASGALTLDGVHVNDGDLRLRLRARVAMIPTLAATLSSPSNVPYSRVVQVMDIVRQCGVQEMSMVAARP